MYQKKKQFEQMIIGLIDLMVIFICLLISGLIRYKTIEGFRDAANVKLTFWSVGVFHIALFYVIDIYKNFYHRNRFQEIALCAVYNLLLVALSTFVGFSMKQEVFTSRLVMGYFLLIDTAALFFTHIIIRNRARIFRFGERRKTSVLIMAESSQVREIVGKFCSSKEKGWQIAGIVLLDLTEVPAEMKNQLGGTVSIMPFHENSKEYLDFATNHVVDEVFVQMSDYGKSERILQMLIWEFEQMGVVVNVSLSMLQMNIGGSKQVYTIEEMPVMAFSSNLFDFRMVVIKRVIDVVGAIIGLVITFVVGLFLAPPLLLESPGPLIFKQKRVGSNGRIFNFYKFRSMYKDAEARKKELMNQNEMKGLMFKIENDPRITKVGAFIRKTSIDELPQFWNVLKGDMSLVGTRPPTLDEYMQYRSDQKRRISFRPGITGLWQVSGRSDIKDFDEVVRLDLEYIDNWSLGLDFKLILKTVGMIFSRKSGAK